MIELDFILMMLLLGSVVGLLAGLFGIGGGGLMVPILTSIFLANGVPIDEVLHLALGTSMASIVITSFSSMRAHHAKGAINWPIVKRMSSGILIGTFMATFLATKLSTETLAIFFSVFMGWVSLQMFFKTTTKPSKIKLGLTGFIGAGTGIGAISALVSIGGGSLTVPFLHWQNISMRHAIATSAAIGFPLSIAGTLGYIINGWGHSSDHLFVIGYISLTPVLLISMMSYMTAPIGASLAHKLPVPILKKVFAILLLMLSLKMLLSII